MNKKIGKTVVKYLIIGILAGFVSGFFGAGGGVVLIFALCLMSKDNESVKGAFAETALITATYSLVSGIIYYVKGNLPYDKAFSLIVPALIGGLLGAVLLDKLPIKPLKKIFGAVVIIAGLIMIFR